MESGKASTIASTILIIGALLTASVFVTPSVNAQPSDWIPLATNPYGDTQPDYSPDGEKIAFMRWQSDGWTRDIWTMDTDGSNQELLITGGVHGWPDWSPDGTRIVCSKYYTDYRTDLIVIDVNTKAVSPLVENWGPNHTPKWSPDGSKIVFAHEDEHIPGGLWNLYTINSDGTGLYKITNYETDHIAFPDWSPDGTKIAIARAPSHTGPHDIFLMDTDGSNEIRIVETGHRPAFLPDGNAILFKRDNDWFSASICRTDNVLQLLDCPSGWETEACAVSPDGSELAFSARPTSKVPNWNVFSMPAHVRAWIRTYGGSYKDYGTAVIETSDGGYAVLGQTDSFGAGAQDFWLVRTDSEGNMLWNRTYGGDDGDGPSSLVQTSDGGYAMAGGTSSFGAGGTDCWLVKANSTGHVEWSRTYGGLNDDSINSMIQTDDGGYALACYTGSFGIPLRDIWLIKTDSAGHIEWDRTYTEVGWQYPFSLVQTEDGGYAFVGWTTSSSSFYGPRDMLLTKTDSIGYMEWAQTYGGEGWEVGYSMVQASDCGYALFGYTESYGVANRDFWLVKTDAFGNSQWNQTYGGGNEDLGYGMAKTSDGYVLAGYTYSFGLGNMDGWIVKTDLAGNAKWNKTYGGPADDQLRSILQTTDGGYISAGSTSSSGEGDYDFWLIRLACMIDAPHHVIPEVPWGSVVASAAMIVALVAYVAKPKWKRKRKHPID